MNTVYAPSTVTTAETFLWYRASPRLQLGLAHLWKQGAFRGLGSYRFVDETARSPSLSLSVGVQGIGTGNPGYGLTMEKNVRAGDTDLNAFVGLGLRSNEAHGHPIGGLKVSRGSWTLGFQHDGHQGHPFVTTAHREWVFGFYLIGGQRAAWMVGRRW